MNRRNFIKCVGYGGSLFSTAWLSVAHSIEPLSAADNLKTFRFYTETVDSKGQTVLRRQHQAKYFSQEVNSDSTIDMVRIPDSRYMMGGPKYELKRGNYETPVHTVAVESAFISKTLITQRQWRKVSALPKIRRDLKSNPSYFKGDDRPVESVSWLDASEFCDRLSKLSGKTYSVPSEALWESACRANTTTPFSFGSTVTSEHANYSNAHSYASEDTGLPLRETTDVERFLPNAYGLYDMHGNVWEWCSDTWHETYRGAPKIARSWSNGGDSRRRVVRGGSWADEPSKLRSASRSGYASTSLNRIIGFRVSVENA